MSQNKKEHFRIDPHTGFIQAKKQALDRELCEKYELKIGARDNPGQTTKANMAHTRVIVNVLDLNDNAPKFLKHAYKFELKENAPFAKRFGRVRAVDLDKPNTTYSEVKYAILESANLDDSFRVDPLTGDLFQLKPLDFEKRQLYEFALIAFDNRNASGNSLSSQCLIRIEVLDLNDNAPEFSSPVSASKPVVITLNIHDDGTDENVATLLKLNATDLDSKENGKLTFSIEKQIKLKQKADDRLNGNFKQHQYFNVFECDAFTGQITLRHSEYFSRHQQIDSAETGVDYKLQHVLGVYALVVKVRSYFKYFRNKYF